MLQDTWEYGNKDSCEKKNESLFIQENIEDEKVLSYLILDVLKDDAAADILHDEDMVESSERDRSSWAS